MKPITAPIIIACIVLSFSVSVQAGQANWENGVINGQKKYKSDNKANASLPRSNSVLGGQVRRGVGHASRERSAGSMVLSYYDGYSPKRRTFDHRPYVHADHSFREMPHRNRRVERKHVHARHAWDHDHHSHASHRSHAVYGHRHNASPIYLHHGHYHGNRYCAIHHAAAEPRVVYQYVTYEFRPRW